MQQTRLGVILPHGILEAPERCTHRGNLLLRSASREEIRRLPFEERAHLVDLLGLGPFDPRDGGAFERRDDDEALGFELA